MFLHLFDFVQKLDIRQFEIKMNKQIERQLLQIFNSLRVQKSKQTTVDKSTLISLLIYHELDKNHSEYFRYIIRQLQKINKASLSQTEYLKIFMNPEIDLGDCDNNELADAFSILDVEKSGSINLKDFLSFYKRSQNYQKLSEDKKRQAEDEIKQAFYSASQDGKITPMDFYDIVKFR